MVKKYRPKSKLSMIVYMEGGGDTKSLHTELRQGMRLLLEKAGLKGMMPGVFACGTRGNAYRDFKNASRDCHAFLLVDSESAVEGKHQGKPWEHLKKRDGWDKPEGTTDDQCHLMVQCMESWFLADGDAVAHYFGQGFNGKHFPPQGQNVEAIDKPDVYSKIEHAIRACSKHTYSKGRHSFAILGQIDPGKVKAASPWAERFFDTLQEHCNQKNE